METLRCPTCLSLLLDGGAKRCGSCGKRLGNRGRPVVLGESNRIASRPALPIEWELNRRVAAENAAHDHRRRAAAKSHHPVEPVVAPTLFAPEVPAPEKVRHARRGRRRGTPKPVRIDEDAPTLFEPPARAEFVEPELLVEAPAVEVPVVESPVVEVPVAEAPVVEREVVIPEVLFDDEPVATTDAEVEPRPEMIDLELETEIMVEDELAERRPPARPNMFSATGRNPRVKKMAKGRRGWVVDYVVPESDSDTEGTAS